MKLKGKFMTGRIITTKDIELSTESFGSENNACILLLAGATVSMLFWDAEFCEKLAQKGFFVIRYDNRDVGQSTSYEPGTTPYDIVDLTNDAFAVLDGYNIECAHFFGISLGGMISQIAAILHPERVKSLILMSTIPWGDSDPSIPEMDHRILDFQSKAEEVDWLNEERVVNYLLTGAQLISGKKEFERERSEQMIRAEFKRANNYRSMYNHAALGGGEVYWNRLDEIKHPALIIHGTDDLICHYKHAPVLQKKIRNADLLTLEGTGHELHSEDWDLIINNINDYISAVK